MTTLADLQATIGGALRDSAHSTFSTSALSDLINQGIDAIADFYPKEIVQAISVSADPVHPGYDASDFTSIFRIDLYDDTTYRGSLEHLFGNDAEGGWELHAGVLSFPPSLTVSISAYTVRAWGYGRYIQLSASSSTTDLDASGIHALKAFCQMEAFGQLMSDRMKFQQWQANSNSSDVTMLALAQAQSAAVNSWRRQQQRLRRVRKQ